MSNDEKITVTLDDVKVDGDAIVITFAEGHTMRLNLDTARTLAFMVLRAVADVLGVSLVSGSHADSSIRLLYPMTRRTS